MRRCLHLVLAPATMLLLVLGGLAPGPAAAETAYEVREDLHFKVTVGPDDDQVCDVVGDVYVPRTASATNRVPAVLSTNGFGGSKDDQAAMSAMFASRGYVALTYSGLGFGGSSCKITLDTPDFDGKAASQLIGYLGGAEGVAFTDVEHTQAAAPLDVVTLDGPGDPRVGMVGGSYGGQVQYAAASVDPRLDTIVPLITWDDLSYSLAPNNTGQTSGVSTAVPGATKLNWVLGFSGIGAIGDVQNQQPPDDLLPCPNFADFVCPALVRGAVTGTLGPADVERLREASVSSYVGKVRIPTLILQGQADTLFNLNEAVATYEALKAQGTPVKMSWVQYGHSGDPAPGEIDFSAPDPDTQHLTRRIVDWFAHYLKDDRSAPTGPEFSWFRDWVRYDGPATPAYAESPSYPVGTESTYHLSGRDLVTDRDDVQQGSQSFLTAGAGAPTSTDPPDVLDRFFEQPEQLERDLPGTFARYDTARLPRAVDVVGSPRARIRLAAPTAVPGQDSDLAKLVLFLKVVDVAPDGSASVVRNLVAPVRVPDVAAPFTVTMPAIAHRFAAGHRIRLVVAGGSVNYRGGNTTTPVTITTAPDRAAGTAGRARVAADALPDQSLTLPTLEALPASPGSGSGPGPGPGVPAPPTPNPGDSPGGGNGAPGNGSGAGGAQPGSQASGQGGPRAGGSSVSASDAAPTAGPASGLLPDTGGPTLRLLGAGLLLVALGAHVLVRRRTARTS